jgi:hypothetical protein
LQGVKPFIGFINYFDLGIGAHGGATLLSAKASSKEPLRKI